MPYDELLAKRVRNILTPYAKHLEEKKMIGGLCFMYKGKMSCGIVKEDLMVRVLREKYDASLKKAHCRVMDFTGKVLKGFLYVDKEGIQTEKKLRSWIELGIEFVDEQKAVTKVKKPVKK